MSPKYFVRPECPNRTLFICERLLHGEVSVEWCAQTWREVNGPKPAKRWPQRTSTMRERTCRKCPLGAEHAGVEFAPSAVVVDSKVCPRCRRFAERLIHSRLCVSCYNRDRERRIGRNAKGVKPKELPPVYRLHVLAKVKNSAAMVRDDSCVDREEAVIAAFRALGSLAAVGFYAKHAVLQSGGVDGLGD